MSTPQLQPADTSALREQYLAEELDYITANFPVISPRFRRTLRRIATLTLFAVSENAQNPQQTRAGKVVDILLPDTSQEWPNITFEHVSEFTVWYAKAVSRLDLSAFDIQTLLRE